MGQPASAESITDSELESAYAYSLAHLMRLDRSSALRLFELFPQFESWRAPWREKCHQPDISQLEDGVRKITHTNWEAVLEQAIREIHNLNAAHIRVIPLSSPQYPLLLRLCPDRPVVLFLKGCWDNLANPLAITLIGTRNALPIEENLAFRIAECLAVSNCLIVSGLNQGIEAAAQRGVLDCGRKGLAVFGNSLDKIYPAENKKLAFRILDQGGAWISEIPIGRKTAFRKCHRLSVGLSTAIVPMQIDRSRSVRRAIRCAGQYSRLLCYPQLSSEKGIPKRDGTVSRLLNRDSSLILRENAIPDIIEPMNKHRHFLLRQGY